MAKMFDTSLRIDAAGPGGIPVVNNLRFLRHSAWFALDRVASGLPRPRRPLTSGNASIVLLRGEEGARRYFTDNDVFERLSDGVFALRAGTPVVEDVRRRHHLQRRQAPPELANC